MSSSLNRIKKNIIEAMQSANNQGTSAYDSVAEVRRVEGDTAWVHIAGGVDETPVKLTIAAKVGDVVQVRVGGGRAWITGNASAPPTDDKTAIVAKSLANIAGNRAKVAQKTADQAQIAANSALKGTKENAAQMAQMVIDFNGDIENLQDQIDGNIATWFYDVDPAMDLPPVTDWDTDEKKDAHLGDIYYNTVKGYAWRFMKSGSTYSWERITDTDVTKALADAAKAQDTADSKRRVFYNTPTVPYDAGDLWVQGSGGDILRCAQAKTSTGSYDRKDWVLASKYTDNSALNAWIEGDFATTIQGLEEGLADAKIETYYQTTDPSTGWSDTQKSEHEGDLWYNSTASVQKYYRWSGTAWQELTATPPQAVFDNIDKKATIYTGTSTPTNPSSGDLWFKGADEPILTYVNNSWVEYNKYTDDSVVNNLEIGGRNYVVKKDSYSITANGITVDYDGDVYHVYGTNTKTDDRYSIGNWVQRDNVFEPEAVYTVSTTIPLPSGLYLGINTRNSSGTEIRAASNSYFYGDGSKTSNTFTCIQDTNGYLNGFFGVEASCGTVDVTFKIKLEKGNKATDWTPAPEDVDEDIDNVWEKADNAQTSIDNLEIGGRNLLIGSEKGVVNTNADTSSYADIKLQAYNGSTYLGQEFAFGVTAGEHIEYTYTSKYSGDNIRIGDNGSKHDAVNTFLVPEYKEGVVYTFSCDVIDDRPNVVGGYVLKNIKLEKGNKATDWTPAPEDIESRTTVLEAASAKELVRNGFAEFTNDPKLTLGKTTSPWKVIVKNDGIFLQKSSNDVASLSKETSSEETTLRADNARLANVKFRSANGGGKLGIVAQSNGHVSLKEI